MNPKVVLATGFGGLRVTREVEGVGPKARRLNEPKTVAARPHTRSTWSLRRPRSEAHIRKQHRPFFRERGATVGTCNSFGRCPSSLGHLCGVDGVDDNLRVASCHWQGFERPVTEKSSESSL